MWVTKNFLPKIFSVCICIFTYRYNIKFTSMLAVKFISTKLPAFRRHYVLKQMIVKSRRKFLQIKAYVELKERQSLDIHVLSKSLFFPMKPHARNTFLFSLLKVLSFTSCSFYLLIACTCLSLSPLFCFFVKILCFLLQDAFDLKNLF